MIGAIVLPTKKTTARKGVEVQGAVVHWTGGRDSNPLKRVKTWADAPAASWPSSTDFVVCRDPAKDPTMQLHGGGGQFSRYTWHCGGSVWHGVLPGKGILAPEKHPNLFCLGFDLDNYGFLDGAEGRYSYRRTRDEIRAGKPEEAFKGPIYVDPATGRGYEAYPEAQVLELLRVVRLAVAECPALQERDLVWPGALADTLPIVGHETIRSTKSDPGPALDWAWPLLYEAAAGRSFRGLSEV